MSSAITFYLNEIIKDFDDWKAFVTQIYGTYYDNPGDVVFDQFVYDVLTRYFSNVNIRYRDPNTFLCQLANVYRDRFRQFAQERRIIDAIHALTLEDLQLASQILTNVANDPNTEPTNPLKPLNYISAQSFSQTTNNKLRSYFEAINNMPSLRINDFIKGHKDKEDISFSDLFMNVQIQTYPIFDPEEIPYDNIQPL